MSESRRALAPSRSATAGARSPLTYGDRVMKPFAEAVEAAAATAVPVTLVGEIGTGKKTAARWIHAMGTRADKPLVVVCCRGREDRHLVDEIERSFAADDAGTVVLDGVEELPAAMQSRLSATIDARDSLTLGPRRITTTRAEPHELLAADQLRPELYLHLAVVSIRVPPLRERREDLPHLAAQLADEIATAWGVVVPRLDDSALAALHSASWPGNVRELRSALERAVASARDGWLRSEHLRASDYPGRGSSPSLAEVERAAIARALDEVGGNRRRAAANLGIGVRTLYDKIKRYRID